MVQHFIDLDVTGPRPQLPQAAGAAARPARGGRSTSPATEARLLRELGASDHPGGEAAAAGLRRR